MNFRWFITAWDCGRHFEQTGASAAVPTTRVSFGAEKVSQIIVGDGRLGIEYLTAVIRRQAFHGKRQHSRNSSLRGGSGKLIAWTALLCGLRARVAGFRIFRDFFHFRIENEQGAKRQAHPDGQFVLKADRWKKKTKQKTMKNPILDLRLKIFDFAHLRSKLNFFQNLGFWEGKKH